MNYISNAKALASRLGLTGAALALLGASQAMSEPFKCPQVGGEFTFAQDVNVNSLDPMASSTISTRNVAMNIFEALLTRSDKNLPIPDLAESFGEAPDGLSYTFKLRQGVTFHNGKAMTSADVLASFQRYTRVGVERIMLENVDRFEAPDAATFVIHMKRKQPTFIEQISSFNAPIIIVPAENADAAAMQLKTVGTGPWELVDFVPGSHAKLKRFEAYAPNTAFENRSGFGGYKQACFDTVVFRIVTEPGARVAGLVTGEFQGVEDVPALSAADLKGNGDITLLSLENWWIQNINSNLSASPTDNLAFRKAVQAALDMDEIMDAATDGNYRLNIGFQYPNQPSYTEAGKETYNIKDPARAKEYLKEAGYNNEPVILLTNKDYSSDYNAALVVSEQLKAVGINTQLQVVDFPTSVKTWQQPEGWNFFFSGFGTPPSLGPLAVIRFMTGGVNASYRPKDGKDDPDLLAAWNDMNVLPTPEERQAAYERAQRIVLERAYNIPFGTMTKVQAVRSNVKGFEPFRIPRMSNVWFDQPK